MTAIQRRAPTSLSVSFIFICSFSSKVQGNEHPVRLTAFKQQFLLPKRAFMCQTVETWSTYSWANKIPNPHLFSHPHQTSHSFQACLPKRSLQNFLRLYSPWCTSQGVLSQEIPPMHTGAQSLLSIIMGNLDLRALSQATIDNTVKMGETWCNQWDLRLEQTIRFHR